MLRYSRVIDKKPKAVKPTEEAAVVTSFALNIFKGKLHRFLHIKHWLGSHG